MDPISAMATATAAFSALKKGFAIGRDIESMASDLSRWMGALSDLDQMEKEAKNPPIFKKLFGGQSVEQEAIAAFANKQKAEKQRYELQQWISLTLGKSKWDELVRMEGQIRKRRKETLYLQRERRRKFIEVIAWIIFSAVGASVLIGLVLLLKSHAAMAQNDLTVCRLVKCMKIDKNKEACVYRGAHNTQETNFFEYGEWKPREYLCQWDIDQPPPPDVYEVLEGIKNSQN
jgi:hypothetical protein|tara:strand:+ start:1340 stop:2035 length:696 start_codon:yes stop_codon:yes gene_type:complete